ncbi:MAG: hypothetical protein M3Z36_12340 [Acidobacteriota bacterium]|nr:hypothetical protein [Acidobacteriota bacterium]
MTPDTQALISATLPTLAVLIGILVNNSRLSDLRSLTDKRFDDVNRRFDDVRDYIRVTSERHDANLRRVEEVIDARLKHLEEQRR